MFQKLSWFPNHCTHELHPPIFHIWFFCISTSRISQLVGFNWFYLLSICLFYLPLQACCGGYVYKFIRSYHLSLCALYFKSLINLLTTAYDGTLAILYISKNHYCAHLCFFHVLLINAMHSDILQMAYWLYCFVL